MAGELFSPSSPELCSQSVWGRRRPLLPLEAVCGFQMCGPEIVFTAAPRWVPNVLAKVLRPDW
ncbi:hypothetical protein A2U01_0060816 [Trifolium medium]|uniref:Uncharacterized protein n=1 Tax=Trifolium medium TaxID=97028 RepID=A0A392RU50_9FABA|nr:hypothetical protein [Trifolium medium]